MLTFHHLQFLRDFQLLLTVRKDPLRKNLRVHVVQERGKHESFGVNPYHFFTGQVAGKANILIVKYLKLVLKICMTQLRIDCDYTNVALLFTNRT